MSVEIQVLKDPARACSVMLLNAVLAGGHIALTGGSTPADAYESLASAVRSLGIDLTDTAFWFGDDRAVAPDDDLSNYKLAKDALFDRLADLGSLDVRRIKGELGYAEAATDYEAQLREAGSPEFELVLLGLGPDGHVASLFPDQETLNERERLVVGVPEAGHEPFVPRVSLTLTALARTRQMVFLVSGESKAEAVASAFGPEASPDHHVPASLLPPMVDNLTLLLDTEAAARLS